MLRRIKKCGWIFLVTLAISSPVSAVTWDNDSPPGPPGDTDYAAGMDAFKREDWREVIEKMTLVLNRRPWHDDAHNRIGYAYRKLRDYPKALEHYNKALELNPYHRGAMEYLGETYLERGCRTQALETLNRLAVVCRRVFRGESAEDWKSQCSEWRDLSQAIETHGGADKPKCGM